MLVTLFVVALALEVLGMAATIKEYLDGRGRWHRLFAPPKPEPVRGGGRVRGGSGKATWKPHEPPNIEARVAALEKRLNWHVKSIRKQIARVEDSIPERAERAATKVEKRLEPQVLNLIAHLSGQYDERPRWLPVWWTGPALLVAGVLVGFVANLWGVLATT
jgi:hypothetical protein